MLDTSLRILMRNCIDFVKKETLLQTQAHNMGDLLYRITVDKTPKCHSEISGEGIEYYWGFENIFYGQLPLDEKNRKDNFY